MTIKRDRWSYIDQKGKEVLDGAGLISHSIQIKISCNLWSETTAILHCRYNLQRAFQYDFSIKTKFAILCKKLRIENAERQVLSFNSNKNIVQLVVRDHSNIALQI